MKIEKIGKLIANFYDKSEYVIHIRNLKQALNHGLVFFKKLIKWLNLIKILGYSLILIWTLISEKKQNLILKKFKLIY